MLAALGVSLALAAGAPPTGAELAELSKPAVRAPIASERIYFVLTDRYANGDASNDRGGLTGPRGVTGFDPTDTGYFHGGDFRGLASCERIKQLGFTAIWVTPPFVQKTVQGSSAAYHGYWGVDFTRVDPHLGTDADFAAFVGCAHRNGMKVILDVVPNHTADVIQLDSTAYVAPPAPPHAATVPEAERDLKRPAWLNDPANYHNRGNQPSSCDQTCAELGDFFGLDDLATERPNVREGLAQTYEDWIRRFHLDGFRVDTARHVDAAFFPFWVPRMLAAGGPNFEIFGEAFIRDAVQLSTFVRDRGLPNVLDFPLQEPAVRFAAARGNGAAIAGRLADDDYFALPSGVVSTPPTFLGNHDIGRAALNILAVGPPARPSLLRRVVLGYDLLYLLRGAPVVYYGDEVGIIGSGGDKDARQDLFPTQVREWQTDRRVGSAPIGTRSSLEITNHPIENRLRALAALRDRYPVFATGATHVRVATRRLLAFSRIDFADRREYVAVLNSGPGPAKVKLQTSTPSSAWTRLLGTSGARSSAAGSMTVTVPAASTLVLRAARQLPARESTVSIRRSTDGPSGLLRIDATVGGGPVSVTFAINRAGRWERIASDDSPPYRAFLNPSVSGELVAVARTPDGTVAVSSLVTRKGTS